MCWLQARSLAGGLEAQLHIDVSIPLFLPQFPSNDKQNLFKNYIEEYLVRKKYVSWFMKNCIKIFFIECIFHSILSFEMERYIQQRDKVSAL